MVPLSVWGMYNGGTDNQQLFVNDDNSTMFLEILFDILSFSATTWQFFATLSDSLYWDHLMIPPQKIAS